MLDISFHDRQCSAGRALLQLHQLRFVQVEEIEGLRRSHHLRRELSDFAVMCSDAQSQYGCYMNVVVADRDPYLLRRCSKTQ